MKCPFLINTVSVTEYDYRSGEVDFVIDDETTAVHSMLADCVGADCMAYDNGKCRRA